MNRRYFVTATATAAAIPLPGCTGPEDDGESEEENGGSGPYGKVDGPTRPSTP